MKNVRPIMVILAIITVVELIMTKGMEGTFWLWIFYGIYRCFEDSEINIG